MGQTLKTFLVRLSVALFSLILSVNGLTKEIGNKRFEIVTGQKGNWYQANLACTNMGMTLAAVESETEYKTLKDFLYQQDHSDDSFWLSGSNLADDTANNDYTWFSNGNKLKYTIWNVEPAATAKQCIYTNSKFKWEIDACDSATTRQFICSRPLVPNCGITGRCRRNRNFYF